MKQVAEKAVDAFIQMRETEGQRLYEDVMSRAETILNIVGQIEERSPETVTEYRERLEAKLREVLNDTTIDEQRILTEAAILRIRSPWRKKPCVCAAISISLRRS